jgi:hypothetical protein
MTKFYSKSINLRPLQEEDDGLYLVKDYYQMAFPPLRSYFYENTRSWQGRDATPIMSYIKSDDEYRDTNYYMWAWPWASQNTTPTQTSVYFSNVETMKMTQSLRWETYNEALNYSSVNANTKIVTDRTSAVPSLSGNNVVQHFSTFFPDYEIGELYIEGTIEHDDIESETSWFYEPDQTCVIDLTVSDTHSKKGYIWVSPNWNLTGKYYTAFTTSLSNMKPGGFSFKIPLSSMTRRSKNVYVDATNSDEFTNPSEAPSFTPPEDLTTFEWPNFDTESGLTRVGEFKPGEIVNITLAASPTDNSEKPTAKIKMSIKTVRFVKNENLKDIYYLEDKWYYNDPVGSVISSDGQFTTITDKFGEGYSLNATVYTESALKYLYADNRWNSKLNYPFAMYIRAKIYDPHFLDGAFYSEVPNLTLASLSGPFVGYPYPWDGALEINGGYPSIAIKQPNFETWNSPHVYVSNTGNIVVDSTDIAIMDTPPDNGKYGENWRLKANTEYQFLINFSSSEATVDENGIKRADIKLYILDEGGPYLVGWSQWQNQTQPYMGERDDSLWLAHTGAASQVILGADGFYGAISRIAHASLPEFRLYSDALTEEEITGIVAGNPKTDTASAKLAQAWFLPEAEYSWKQIADPRKPNAIYQAVDGDHRDVMRLGIATPKIYSELWDTLSTVGGGKLTFQKPLTLSTDFKIKFTLDNDRTYAGRYLNPIELNQVLIQPQGAIENTIKLKQLYFKQENKVLVYQPVSLNTEQTYSLAPSFELPDVTNLYWRVSLPEGANTTTGQLRFTFFDGSATSAVFDSDIFTLQANNNTVSDEINVKDLIKSNGEVFDSANINSVTIEQLSGSSINLERLDFRIARFTLISQPTLVTSTESLEFNFNYLNVPANKGFYVNVVAENLSGKTTNWYLRIDDAYSAGNGYYNRYDLEDPNVPPGPFVKQIQLDGLHSNKNAYNPGRFMDITKISRIIANSGGNILYKYFNILQGFQFKVAKAQGWHFGDAPAASGFNTVVSSDTNSANNSWYLNTYSTSPINGSQIVPLQSGATQLLAADAFNNIALRYVKRFTAKNIDPGTYDIVLWNEWINEYGNWSRTLRRTTVVNGVTIEDMNYQNRLHDWMNERKMQSREVEYFSDNDNPWDTYGHTLGNPITANNIVVSNTNLLQVTVNNADTQWATEMVGLMINPIEDLTDKVKYFGSRKSQFNTTHTIIDWGDYPWRTLTTGEYKIIEISFQSEVKDSKAFENHYNDITPIEHVVARGVTEHIEFICLSGEDAPESTLSVSNLTSGSNSITPIVRWGQWNIKQSVAGTRTLSYWRGEIDKFNIKKNVPRGIFLQIDVPANAPGGLYTGIITVNINGAEVTKEFKVRVIPISLPTVTKGVGSYLFDNPYSLWISAPGQTQGYGTYTRVRQREIENHVKQGMNMLAVPTVPPFFDTAYPSAPSGETTYATYIDKFLAELREYKTAGMGNTPYFLYQQFSSFITSQAFTSAPSFINAMGNTFSPSMSTLVAKFPATMLGAGNTFSREAVHEYYRSQLNITDPTDTLKFIDPETDDSVLWFRNYMLWASVNGTTYVDIPYTIGNEGPTGNNEKNDLMNLDPSAVFNPGDEIWLFYRMDDYDWIRNGDGTPGATTYIDFDQQRKWLLNRMTEEAKSSMLRIKTDIIDVIKSNTSIYPMVPYVALVDEMPVKVDVNINYIPTPAVDLVRVQCDAIHDVIPEMKTVSACGGDMGGLENFIAAFGGYIDIGQVNNGNFGAGGWINSETINSFKENDITPWIYNSGPTRWLVGFYLWASEFENFTMFSSNGYASLPFNPYSGIADFMTWPVRVSSDGTLQNDPDDITGRFAEYAMGVADHKWCLWLDQQVQNGVNGASTLKENILSQIDLEFSPYSAANGDIPYETMDAMRKQITDFAKQINNIT